MSIRNGIRKATFLGMVFIIGVGLLIGTCSSANASDISPSAPLVIEYFFEPGCDDCARVNGKILPEVDAYYPGLCEIRRFDITQSTNYLHLAHYQISLNKEVNAPVSMVVNGRHLLADIDEIQGQLLKVLDEAIASGEVPAIASQSPEVGMNLLETRVQKFTVIGVMMAGLVDGINPCAISTLVFFMSIFGPWRRILNTPY